MLSFTDAEIRTKAAELGLIANAESPLPNRHRGQVVAALARDAKPERREGPPTNVAESIVVRPGQSVDVDGQPFPWVIQSDAIEVTLDPSGKGLVRLTIPTQSVQIIKPESEQS